MIGDIRSRADAQYHPVCTCKIGSDKVPLAVVDARLKVAGRQFGILSPEFGVPGICPRNFLLPFPEFL